MSDSRRAYEEEFGSLPTNSQERKKIPIYTGVIKYFPDAIAEIARVSYIGSKQHHPDQGVFWDRDKSRDDLDALTRHLMEAGKIDTDGVRHSAKVAWRAMANLQKELENSNERDEQWYIDQYNRNR